MLFANFKVLDILLTQDSDSERVPRLQKQHSQPSFRLHIAGYVANPAFFWDSEIFIRPICKQGLIDRVRIRDRPRSKLGQVVEVDQTFPARLQLKSLKTRCKGHLKKQTQPEGAHNLQARSAWHPPHFAQVKRRTIGTTTPGCHRTSRKFEGFRVNCLQSIQFDARTRCSSKQTATMGTSELSGKPHPEANSPQVDLEGNPNLGPPIPQRSVVLVLDFGSQYTQLIARRVRELGVYSVSLSGDSEQGKIEAVSPTVIILSGGPNSVHEATSPTLPRSFFEWTAEKQIPVLGVCYGMQLIVQVLGGEVKQAAEQEYGRMAIRPVKGSQLYGTDVVEEEVVWMSHGDEAVRLPEGFEVIAKSSGGTIVGVEAPKRHLYGLQYHPEVRVDGVILLIQGQSLTPPEFAALASTCSLVVMVRYACRQ